MQNNGKRFETNFKNSVPKDTYIYRLKDGSASWDKGTRTRFQAKNICDFILYKKPYLFLLELKSTKGKNLPNSNVKTNQLEGLLEASKYDGIICGIVIEFSEQNATYFIEISQYKRFLKNMSRKSLPLDYVAKNGVKIDTEKMRVNSKFDIEKMIKDIVGNK